MQLDRLFGLSEDHEIANSLQAAVERRHACMASLIQTVPVSAFVEGGHTRDIVVHIFHLAGCTKTNRAYAWSSLGAIDEAFVSLDIGPIKSPVDAVGAAIADEYRLARLAARA
ncbi:MAG TPA: hypothetical protein VMI56_12165 [Reyranella sp.]|nr:hypothetical protein [Reyranella sp.]